MNNDKIKFQRENSQEWEEAVNTRHLLTKLNGDKAKIIFPKTSFKEKFIYWTRVLFLRGERIFAKAYIEIFKMRL